jgi:hypothetical protein
MFSRCPKCGHQPLPLRQALPAACPACGVILAKVAQAAQTQHAAVHASPLPAPADAAAGRWLHAVLFNVPDRVDRMLFWLRTALLAGFATWGLALIRLDYRSGAINESFIHGPLLVFHEAGHVVFRLFGQWVMVLGGTLGQLLMPAVLLFALLLKNRDPYGAAIGLWLFGVSLLDVAPYMYDALHPRLMLLSGRTGEDGGHDWIYLFSSLGALDRAQAVGALTHALGAAVTLLALAWAAAVLALQHGRIAQNVLRED